MHNFCNISSAPVISNQGDSLLASLIEDQYCAEEIYSEALVLPKGLISAELESATDSSSYLNVHFKLTVQMTCGSFLK